MSLLEIQQHSLQELPRRDPRKVSRREHKGPKGLMHLTPPLSSSDGFPTKDSWSGGPTAHVVLTPRLYDTPIERWGPCPHILNLGGLYDCFY